MQSVSSNAVATSVSMPIGETDTGGKWIDGKEIYRRIDTWLLASLPTGISNYTFSSAYWSNIDTIIDFRIIRPRTSTLKGAIVSVPIRFDPPTKTLDVYNGNADWNGPFILDVLYTKN